MRSRRLFLTVLLVPVVLMTNSPPAARATSAGALVAVGVANVGNGIAYPCLTGKTPFPHTNVNLQKCLPPDTIAPGGNPNDATFTFAGAGVGSIAKVNDPKCFAIVPTCAHAGVFDIQAAGVVHGACLLSTGEGTGTFDDRTVVGNKPTAPPRPFSFAWTGIGGVLLVTGTWGTSGTLFGTLVATRNAVLGNDCLDKRAKEFAVVGSLAFLGN